MKKQVRLQLIQVFFFGAISFGVHGQVQTGRDIDGEATDDRPGWSVSLSSDGSVLAMGATGINSNAGHTRAYEKV